jgi:hypothetical protein
MDTLDVWPAAILGLRDASITVAGLDGSMPRLSQYEGER